MLVLDDDGNITETIPEETIVEFTYDILGRRIEKKTQDKTINYIYAGQNAIKEIVTDNTTNELIETRENIYSNNLDDILSTIITDHSDNTTEQYYYEKNHLGSIIKITDTNGAIVEQYEYDSFGVAYASVNNVEAVTEAQGNKKLNIKKATGSEADTGNSDELTIDNIRYKRYNGKGKIGNTRLYTGREYDAELKLYYNRARYYSPDLGRFISRDPIDIADDVNLYAYVGNNSVMFVDRSGLEKNLIMEKLVIKFFDYALENTDGLFGIYDFYKGTGRNGIYDLKRNAFISAEVNFNGETVNFNGVDVEPSNLGNLLAGFNMGNTYVPSYFIKDYFHDVEIDNARKQGYSIYSEIIADADEYTDVIWYDAGKNILDEYKKANTIEEKILIITNIIKETNPEYERRSKIETELRIYYTNLLNN